MAALRNGVEPQRHFGQLHGHGVEVHAEHVVVGNVHLHALAFGSVGVVGDGLAGFLLSGLQVGFGQLVDGFVQKGRATHGGLADGELQNFIRRFAGQDFAQGMLDQAAGEHIRRVVAGGFFAGAAGQAVDEGATRVFSRLATEQGFGLRVLANAAGRHEVGGFQRVQLGIAAFLAGGCYSIAGNVHAISVPIRGVVEVIRGCLVINAFFIIAGCTPAAGFGGFRVAPHLEKVFFRKEAAERQQRLVHGAQLVDAQRGVADSPPATALAATRERHQFDDLLQHVVAQPNAVEQRCAFGVEQVSLQRVDGESRLGAAGGIVQQTLLAGGVLVLFRKTLPDEPEQLLQAFVKVETLTGLGGGERRVFQLAQMLDTVALQVGFCLDGGIA